MRKLIVNTTVLVVLLFIGGLLANIAMATERARPIQIGVLTTSWGPTPMIAGVRDGLLELGYDEREDFVIGVRFTQGDITALPAAARQLVQYETDLILVDDDESAKAAQQATSQIPIVFVGVGDPLKQGLIRSFPRPGGNITGVTYLVAGAKLSG